MWQQASLKKVLRVMTMACLGSGLLNRQDFGRELMLRKPTYLNRSHSFLLL